MIGVLNAYEKNLYSDSKAVKCVTLQEDFFFQGMVFSYEDYHTFSEGETKTILVDPTAFMPLGVGVQTRIPVNPMVAYSVSGPVRIDFYSGASSNNNGTLLGGSNRDSTASKLLPDIVLRMNPTGLSKGTRFAGDIIPASISGPGGLIVAGAANSPGIPFAISNLVKYAIDFTNDNGEDVLVQIKITWIEITF